MYKNEKVIYLIAQMKIPGTATITLFVLMTQMKCEPIIIKNKKYKKKNTKIAVEFSMENTITMNQLFMHIQKKKKKKKKKQKSILKKKRKKKKKKKKKKRNLKKKKKKKKRKKMQKRNIM